MDLGYREILLNSDVDDIESLCLTDKFAHSVCQDESVWKQIYQREGIPFPEYPDKFRFYMDSLKNHYKNKAEKWLYYLQGQSELYSELEGLYDDVIYNPDFPTIRIYDIDMLPHNIFNNMDVEQEFKNDWNTFYSQDIEDPQDIYFIQLYFDPIESALLVSLGSEQDDYEFINQYIFEDDMESFISRLLKHGVEFKNYRGYKIYPFEEL